jgi:hypothetical protein
VLVDYIRVCEIPNRCPDIKVGDREETRFADISPCMLWEKRQEGEGEGFCAPGKNTATTWRQAGPVSGRRTSWRFPYINCIGFGYTVPAVRVGKYCIRAYGIRHFQFPRRWSPPVAVAATPRARARPCSPFSILPARLRPSSSSQWINPSGPIGFILSASTDAIPLFSLSFTGRTCMYFLHPRMIIMKSYAN